MGPRSGGKDSSNSGQKTQKLGPKKVFGMKATCVTTPLQTKATVIQNSLSSILATSNSYNIGDRPLSDFDDTEMPNVNNEQNSRKSNKNKNSPIIITNSNVSAVQNMCNKVIQSKKFEVKLLSIGIRVQVSEKEEHDNLCASLTKEKIGYFKYHTTETRPRKIVLLGLHKMETEELKEILAEKGVHPTEIKTLRVRENQYKYADQTVFLLYFKAGTVKIADLRNIKDINHILVQWAPYSPRSHDKYPQCRNCQMYGHSSINCHMPTYCLVCASNHKTDDCPKKVKRAVLEHQKISGEEIDKSFVKCANCGDNHPASYHGCIARKTYIEIQNKFKKPQRNLGKRTDYIYNQEEFPVLQPQRGFQPSHTNRHNWNNQDVQQSQQQDPSMQQLMMSMMTTFNNLVNKLTMMIEQLARVLDNTTCSQAP